MTKAEERALAAITGDLAGVPFGEEADGAADEPMPRDERERILRGQREAFKRSRREGLLFMSKLLGAGLSAAISGRMPLPPDDED